VLAERRSGFIQMTMAGDPAIPDEGRRCYETLARVSGRPILYNVVVPDEREPERHLNTLKWLEDCRKQGLQVYGQALTTRGGLTFTFEDWNLFDEADAWRESPSARSKRSSTRWATIATRRVARRRVFAATGPIKDMVVLSPKSSETSVWKDHTLQDVADATGKHPVDCMLDIAIADRLRTVFYTEPTYTSSKMLKDLLDDKYTIPGVSDGGAHTKFLTAGTYPTELITDAVRKLDILDLESAHWRLSGLPSHCAGFPGRGTLEVGKAADIVVYDYDNLRLNPVEIVHDLPGGEWRRVSRPSGYRFVLVNGTVTIDDDKETAHRPVNCCARIVTDTTRWRSAAAVLGAAPQTSRHLDSKALTQMRRRAPGGPFWSMLLIVDLGSWGTMSRASRDRVFLQRNRPKHGRQPDPSGAPPWYVNVAFVRSPSRATTNGPSIV
jgi:N-acyl-D-aspartate/D-glutamate deacylase